MLGRLAENTPEIFSKITKIFLKTPEIFFNTTEIFSNNNEIPCRFQLVQAVTAEPRRSGGLGSQEGGGRLGPGGQSRTGRTGTYLEIFL